MAVGGHHPHLALVGDQQQAVEVIADILLRHRVLHQRQQGLEGFLRQRKPGLEIGGLGDGGKVLGREGLQGEARFAGLDVELFIVQLQGHIGRRRQGAQDVQQLARGHGGGGVLPALALRLGGDLHLDVGGQERQFVAGLFEQQVGKDGQGVAALDDAADRLDRFQKRIAFRGDELHGPWSFRFYLLGF